MRLFSSKLTLAAISLGFIIAVSGAALAEDRAREGNHQKNKEFMEKYKNASASEKENMLESIKTEHPRKYEKMKKIEKQLEGLSSEERIEKLKELKKNHKKNKAEKREKFENKWNNADAEKRIKICEKAKAKCDSGKKRACKLVESKC